MAPRLRRTAVTPSIKGGETDFGTQGRIITGVEDGSGDLLTDAAQRVAAAVGIMGS